MFHYAPKKREGDSLRESVEDGGDCLLEIYVRFNAYVTDQHVGCDGLENLAARRWITNKGMRRCYIDCTACIQLADGAAVESCGPPSMRSPP
jgi:hypothetical protein